MKRFRRNEAGDAAEYWLFIEHVMVKITTAWPDWKKSTLMDQIGPVLQARHLPRRPLPAPPRKSSPTRQRMNAAGRKGGKGGDRVTE